MQEQEAGEDVSGAPPLPRGSREAGRGVAGRDLKRNHFGQRDIIFILFHLTRLHEYNSDTQK